MARPFKVIAGDASAPESTDSGTHSRARRIGELLVDLGRLSPQQVSLILLQQGQSNQRFGELAVGMGFVSTQDIDYVVARQAQRDASPTAREPGPSSRQARAGLPSPGAVTVSHDETLRAVRSQLMLRWFGEDIEQHTLAVLSPGRGDGRSHICSHLAVLIAQLEEQTLVIDADLRHPSMHTRFGLDNNTGLTSYLQREVGKAPVRAAPGRPFLDVLTAGPILSHAHELIERRAFGLLLEDLAQRYQYILIDTPAAGRFGEALTIAIRSSGCVLVTRKHRTRLTDLQSLSSALTGNGVEVLGAVINEA